MNGEDPYAVVVDILSKFRMKMVETWVNTSNTKPIVLCSIVVVFCNVHCTSKIDGHYIITIILTSTIIIRRLNFHVSLCTGIPPDEYY